MNTNTILIVFSIIVLFAIGLFAYYLYHKLSAAIDRSTKYSSRLANNTISQIEALLSLYTELKPKHGFPKSRGWAASPDFLREIHERCLRERPNNVLECSSGLSTLIIAYCLKTLGGGKVFSLENDPIYANHTRELIKKHDLEKFSEVIDAPLRDLSVTGWAGKWYDLSGMPSDLIAEFLIVDGPPAFTQNLARYPAYPMLKNYLSDSAIIVCDDAKRVDERSSIDRWISEDIELRSILNDEESEKGIVVLQRFKSAQ